MLKFYSEIIFCFHTSPFCLLTELVAQRQILTEMHFARYHYYADIEGGFTLLNISTVNRLNQ